MKRGQWIGTFQDIHAFWKNNLVTFLLGCSFSFENALIQGGCSVRHIEEGKNVPMYITGLQCRPVYRLSGPLVVSMRPMTSGQASKAAEITNRYPLAHGKPVHMGDPEKLGISDMNKPDFGDHTMAESGLLF